jgi:hypothetical protein
MDNYWAQHWYISSKQREQLEEERRIQEEKIREQERILDEKISTQNAEQAFVQGQNQC